MTTDAVIEMCFKHFQWDCPTFANCTGILHAKLMVVKQLSRIRPCAPEQSAIELETVASFAWFCSFLVISTRPRRANAFTNVVMESNNAELIGLQSERRDNIHGLLDNFQAMERD